MISLDNISNQRILVIGDVMVDSFVYGNSSRLSQEAPVPVVKVDNKVYKLGGASNVSANLSALGCQVDICGLVGNDTIADVCKHLLSQYDISSEHLVTCEQPTILKTRIISNNQHIVRFDEESIFSSSLVDHLSTLPDAYDGIIISDYAKGTINQRVMECIKNKYKNTFIIVDPKPRNYKLYYGVSAITPNLEESRKIFGVEDADPYECAKFILKDINCDFVIITLSEKGVLVLSKDEQIHLNVHPISVDDTYRPQKIDVTGAGDALISSFTAGYCSGLDVKSSLVIANIAAAITVNKIGTDVCYLSELEREISLWKDDGYQRLGN